MSEAINTPSLSQALRNLIDSEIVDTHTAIPARVESYDNARQEITAKPLVQRTYRDENGDRQSESLPVIVGVPVVFPGAGAYSITFPIAAGDTVLLVFSERSIDKWLDRGGEVEPRSDRHHNISDAIAIPGLRSFAEPLESAPNNALAIVGAEVRLGDADASDPVARKSDIDALVNVFNTHTHQDPSTGFTGPPADVTGPQLMDPIDGSSKVRTD